MDPVAYVLMYMAQSADALRRTTLKSKVSASARAGTRLMYLNSVLLSAFYLPVQQHFSVIRLEWWCQFGCVL